MVMKMLMIKFGFSLCALFLVDQGIQNLATPEPVLPDHFEWAEATQSHPIPFIFRSFSAGTDLQSWPVLDGDIPMECSENCEAVPLLTL